MNPAVPANTAWWLASLPAAARFGRAMRDVEGEQRALLHRLLRRNAGTVYGRRHDFAGITSAEDYQARVPLVSYEDIIPEIEAMAAGTADVLFPGRPSSFVPTSGSMAATKLIPYNAELRAEFQAGIAPWVAGMFRDYPALFGGPGYWSISPATGTRRMTAGGIHIGCEDDTEYLHPAIARLLGRTMAVPAAVARIPDMAAFRYVTLLFLLRARELRLISVWNPTFLSLLLAPLVEWGEALARDVAQGTISSPGELSLSLPPLAPNPCRAREVEKALSASEPARYELLWPRLALISCWTSAAAAGPARELARLFPHVPIAGKGLLATEGFVSFPLAARRGCAPAVRSHFFEFIDNGGASRTAWQLEEGAEYQVALTTGGGLYRYLLGDIVRVAGFAGACPLLEFIGRSGSVCDLYGEKLNEGHVAPAIATACAAAGIDAGFALLAPEGGNGYTLFLAAGMPVAEDHCARLRDSLEQELRENIHYDYCRRLGQLSAINVCLLSLSPAAAQAIFLQTLLSRGRRAGSVKPACLDPDPHWRNRFTMSPC
jgi:hypothetical protein